MCEVTWSDGLTPPPFSSTTSFSSLSSLACSPPPLFPPFLHLSSFRPIASSTCSFPLLSFTPSFSTPIAYVSSLPSFPHLSSLLFPPLSHHLPPPLIPLFPCSLSHPSLSLPLPSSTDLPLSEFCFFFPLSPSLYPLYHMSLPSSLIVFPLTSLLSACSFSFLHILPYIPLLTSSSLPLFLNSL